MKIKKKEQLKTNKGITLIALIITIIVLLILAGVTIITLTGQNGIIAKAQSAKLETEKSNEREQIELAVLTSRINDKNNAKIDTTILQKELDKLLEKGEIKEYSPNGDNFKLPCTVIGKTDTIYTIDEDGVEKLEKIDKKTSYVGYYADIDNNGTVDGIIYADLAMGNTGSGQWGSYGYGGYNIPKEDNVENLKNYKISTATYEGQTGAGVYKANDGFGEKEVIVPIESEKKKRFYIMALEDLKIDGDTKFLVGEGEEDANISDDFGKGSERTKNEIARYRKERIR